MDEAHLVAAMAYHCASSPTWDTESCDTTVAIQLIEPPNT
jgi:hypothetical protein